MYLKLYLSKKRLDLYSKGTVSGGNMSPENATDLYGLCWKKISLFSQACSSVVHYQISVLNQFANRVKLELVGKQEKEMIA